MDRSAGARDCADAAGSETTVAAALARLRAEDERVAGDAEATLGSLTWDEGPQAIAQHRLLTFLW